MIWGLINLYETTYKNIYLSRAAKLEVMIEDFYDENGVFIGSKNAETNCKGKRLLRWCYSLRKFCCYCLFKLGKITGNIDWINIAHDTLKAFSDKARSNPSGFTCMLTGLLFDLKSLRN